MGLQDIGISSALATACSDSASEVPVIQATSSTEVEKNLFR